MAAIPQITQIVILGGTGDLSQRKLYPALIDLFAKGKLPKHFRIIGIARTPRSDEQYKTFVAEVLEQHCRQHMIPDETAADFCATLSYIAGSFDEDETYVQLQNSLEEFDISNETKSNRLFYLAVPPNLYGDILSKLHSSKAAVSTCDECWSHILVEKPFGHNLETAHELDALLGDLYEEKQIFRIDHYLAKEAVQNILSFRFANTLLKSSWDKNSITAVHITMFETIDIGDRAGFYEGVGALRDVGQNHLLQLLALVAMNEPAKFTTDDIRDARTRVLDALIPIKESELAERVIRAQYQDYTASESIPEDSDTETYFELKVFLDLPEWEGVPFYLKAGKALQRDEVSIAVTFKDVASGLFDTESCNSAMNKVVLTISPEQSMAITLNSKSHELGFQLESKTLTFNYSNADATLKNSYQKVLYDSIIGDQTLFTKTAEVIASWKFISPIHTHWNSLPLHTYKKGSDGPAQHLI